MERVLTPLVSADVSFCAVVQQYKTEKDFAELLADYDDDEIGELDEPAEEGAETRGEMDVSAHSQ
jgi:hypothetical protein